MAYPTKKFGEVLDYEQPGKYIVNSKNYSSEYKTPVLTAGKTFILGNTNEEENIFPAEKLPVIIFDDFTTAIKFVDFPFKVKSSAMKILHAKKDIADIKFLFYAIQTTGLNHATHKRYWISEYSKIEIPLPTIGEQRKIVEKIEKLFAKIDETQKLREESKKSASALLQSALNEIFSGPKSSKWERIKLGNLIKALTPPKKIQKSNFGKNGKFPIIDQSQNEISGWSDDKTALVQISQPVVIFGDHTCVVKFCGKPFIQGADGIKILSANEKILPRFLYLLLKIDPLKSVSYRRHFSELKEKEILLPPLTEQKKIVAYLDSLSEKVHGLQKFQNETEKDLADLKQSILQESFSGKL